MDNMFFLRVYAFPLKISWNTVVNIVHIFAASQPSAGDGQLETACRQTYVASSHGCFIG